MVTVRVKAFLTFGVLLVLMASILVFSKLTFRDLRQDFVRSRISAEQRFRLLNLNLLLTRLLSGQDVTTQIEAEITAFGSSMQTLTNGGRVEVEDGQSELAPSTDATSADYATQLLAQTEPYFQTTRKSIELTLAQDQALATFKDGFAPWLAALNGLGRFFSRDADFEDYVDLITESKDATGKIRNAIYKFLALSSGDEEAQTKLDIELAVEKIAGALQATLDGSDELEIEALESDDAIQQIHAAQRTFHDVAAALSDLIEKKIQLSANVVDLQRQLDPLLDTADAMRSRAQHNASATIGWFSWLLISLLTCAGVLTLTVCGIIEWQVIRPVRRIDDALEDIAAGQGDLTRRLQGDRDDEVGRLTNSFNTFAERIRQLVEQVANTIAGLGHDSRELATIAKTMRERAYETATESESLSRTAEQLSTELDQSSRTVEEMNDGIRNVEHNAKQAAQVSQQAVDSVEQALASVRRLGVHGVEISGIVDIINGIAEQTNLLALNATIEAARAGEAGRGFAVVANEVNALSKTTAESTKGIRTLITAIQRETQSTGGLLDTIHGTLEQIHASQCEISTSVREQSESTNGVNRAIQEAAEESRDISQCSHRFTSATELTSEGSNETAAAADRVRHVSNALELLVQTFVFRNESAVTSVGSPVTPSTPQPTSSR